MDSRFRRLYHEQTGQALYLVVALLIALLGMAALSIDIGVAMHAQRELQSITDEAASAGGAAMTNPNLSSTAGNDVYSVVTNYSGSTAYNAVYNVHPDLNITNVNVTMACLSTTTYPAYGLPSCATSANGSYPNCSGGTGCNAIKVVETANVPTFFAKVFGVTSLNISATAIASASGGGAAPYHLAVVLDTTASMGMTNVTGCLSTDPTTQYTAEQCAQLGIQTLLSELTPCPTGVSNCPVSQAVDPVALLTFPGLMPSETVTLTNPPVQGATASGDYACPSQNPTITSYNNNPDYLILPLQSDYRVSDTSGLNFGNSDLLAAVGATTDGSCTGMQTPGGEGTFYAGAILEAGAYLEANHVTGVQDIIIFMSDGDANATATRGMVGSVAQTAPISGLNSDGSFSVNGQCTQAVNAANYDKSLGIDIYSISYNSGSSGCASDASSSPYYNDPCATMQGIASSPLSQYFFSVPVTSGSGTSVECPNANGIQYLDQVFTTIEQSLQTSRLLPSNTGGAWSAVTQ